MAIKPYNVVLEDIPAFEKLHNDLDKLKPGNRIFIPGGPNTVLDPNCIGVDGTTQICIIKTIDTDCVTILFEGNKNVSGDIYEFYDHMDCDTVDPELKGPYVEAITKYFKKYENRDVTVYSFTVMKAFRIQYWTPDWDLKTAEVESTFFVPMPQNLLKYITE